MKTITLKMLNAYEDIIHFHKIQLAPDEDEDDTITEELCRLLRSRWMVKSGFTIKIEEK